MTTVFILYIVIICYHMLYIVIVCYHMLYIVIICYHMQLDLYLLSFILTCVLMYTEPSPMT